MFTEQDEIYTRICTEFLSDNHLVTVQEMKKQFNLLVENKLASSLSGSFFREFDTYSPLFLASKIVCKMDKSMKKFIDNGDEDDSDEFSYNKQALIPREISKIASYELSRGSYLVNLGEDESEDYMALLIYDKDEPGYKFWSLYFIGDHHTKNMKKFLKENSKYEEKDKAITTDLIYHSDRKTPKQVRFKSFDKMVFSGKDKLLKYIDNWKNNIPELYNYGITPKLSILLYGEPGTGKSTFAKAVANRLGIHSIKSISPDYFMNETNGRSFGMYTPVVYTIDDIDCMCVSRETKKKEYDENNSMILYQLLEFLDNPPTCYYKANDGLFYPVSIVIATTNYKDRLDKALIRSGRFDLHVEMTYINYEQAQELCKLYKLRLSDVMDTDSITDKKKFTIQPSLLEALCISNIDKTVKGVNKKPKAK